jgi:hypothetical protein
MTLSTHSMGFRFYASIVVLMMGVITTLAGCGGGSKSPAPPVVNADPTGYYSNTGSINVLDDSVTPVAIAITDAQAMIHNNRLIMLSALQQLAYDGAITVSGNHFTGNVTIYHQGTRVSTAPVSGDIAQGTGITNGVLGGSDPWGKGSFSLKYVAADNTVASLDTVNRTTTDWTGPVGNSFPANFTYNIDALSTGPDNFSISNGLAGGIFKGCGVLGRINPIGGTHLYSVNINLYNLSGCSNSVMALPNYTGIASTREAPTLLMVFSLTNGSYSMDGEFH